MKQRRIGIVGQGRSARHILANLPLPVEELTCGNCGHVTEKDARLDCIRFRWVNPRTSSTACRNCGIMTLQQGYDESFTAGQFLIIRPFNTIRKGK